MQNDDLIPCPYCKMMCSADWCDVGVPGALQQIGPYHCTNCKASEIGPYDEERPLSADEQRTGWYAPGTPPGSSANVIGGEIVTAEEMKRVYRQEFTGNPLWGDEKYMADWWKKTRGAA